jgi:hypothetical protein
MALRELGLEDLNWIKCADPMMSIWKMMMNA